MGNPRTRDLTGNRYGMLVVLAQEVKTFQGKRQSVCRCRCDCGNEVEVPVSHLERRDGTMPKQQTRSCGCKKEIGDLTGQRFGRLVALNASGKTRKKGILWHCRCDCGKETNVAAYQLKTGAVKSCGCALEDAQKAIAGHAKKGAERAHTKNAEIKRAKTRFGKPGSDMRKKAGEDLKAALIESGVFVDRTNVAAIINENPQGKNQYRGVCWNKRKKCWMAYCQVNGHRWQKIGFRTPEAAKEERDKIQQIMIEEYGVQAAIDMRKEKIANKGGTEK